MALRSILQVGLIYDDYDPLQAFHANTTLIVF